MSIAIISHPQYLKHQPGNDHPERPERVSVIHKALERYPFHVPVAFYQAPLVSMEQLLGVHDKSYVDWIISIAPKKGTIAIDADTRMSPGTLEAALYAAGAVCFGVDLVMQNKASQVFCNVRPPGHHAESEKAMGFCFFNNVAVGAHYAIQHYGLERVVIIDFDVHHGNGTQNIFQENKKVLYCSCFEYPFYPGYESEMDNEHILSVPLTAGTQGDEFRQKVEAAWFDKIAAFKPQLIFFSAGFDAHAKDPLANLKLTESDYVWLTMHIANIAKVHCQSKLISVLEGGYQLDVLAQCVPAHVNAMVT